MITLPEGVTIWVKGKKFEGEIPKELCPKKFLKEAPKPKKLEAKKEEK